MAIDDAAIAQIVFDNGQWIKDSANSLRQTQWASAASAAQNEKEQAEYEKIADSSSYLLTLNGTSLALTEQENNVSPFQSIIEQGMDAPLTGGSGGTATNPDGSTYTSQVPEPLQGYPIPEYAKAPNPVSDGIKTMLNSLVPDWVRSAAASSTGEIGELVKDEIIGNLQA